MDWKTRSKLHPFLLLRGSGTATYNHINRAVPEWRSERTFIFHDILRPSKESNEDQNQNSQTIQWFPYTVHGVF